MLPLCRTKACKKKQQQQQSVQASTAMAYRQSHIKREVTSLLGPQA
jgi:hypothetical protein